MYDMLPSACFRQVFDKLFRNNSFLLINLMYTNQSKVLQHTVLPYLKYNSFLHINLMYTNQSKVLLYKTFLSASHFIN